MESDVGSGEESLEEEEVRVPKKRRNRRSVSSRENKRERTKEKRTLRRSFDQKSPVYKHATHTGALFKSRFYKSTPEEAGALTGQLHSGERVRHNLVGILVILENPSLDILEIPTEAAIRSANASDIYGVDPDLFYTILIDYISRNMTSGPNQSILNDFLRTRRLGHDEVKEFKVIGELASKVTFVSLLQPEDPKVRERARNRKAWSTFHPAAPTPSASDLTRPAIITGDNVLVHQYLPLRYLDTPHRDILLRYDMVQAEPRLQFLIGRDNTLQLN
ncbi:hypothetical protein P7C70_g9542, partial [Phenoliferia sp. Uapishka_3]